MGKVIIIFVIVMGVISSFRYVKTKAEVQQFIQAEVNRFELCLNMCQDNFCTADIEGNYSCPGHGFTNCQATCKLKYDK